MGRAASAFAAVVVALVSSAPAAAQGPDLAVEVVAETNAAHPGSRVRMAAVVTVPEGWHINAHEPLEEFLIPTELAVEPAHSIGFAGTVYPEPEEFQLEGSSDTMLVYGGRFPIGFVLDVPDSIDAGDYSLDATLRFQACNDTQCWAPTSLDVAIPVIVVPASESLIPQRPDVFDTIPFDDIAGTDVTTPTTEEPERAEPVADGAWRQYIDDFQVVGRNSGYLSSAAFLEWLDRVESGEGATNLNRFAGMSLWLVIVLTFFGGLALNLTPCVLPLIPINLAIIGAGAQARSKMRGFALGGAYGGAIALVYGMLGLAAAFAGTAFGALNASPWFNLAVALIFIVLGLAMFDLLSIDFSRFQSKLRIERREGGSVVVAFFMGAIAALLAGACVGPVVISVILFSQDLYAKGSPIALALPFLLGLGMALPWPIAGAGLSFLPKPGAWMTRVKYVFGVLIILIALYYGYEGARLFNDRYLVDEQAVEASMQELDDDGWTHSLSAGLAKAKEEGKPVFIDFWATWCKNCLTMNKTTFKDPDVQARLDGYVAVKYQAQFLDRPPAKDVMAHLGVGGFGLPVYVVLNP